MGILLLAAGLLVGCAVHNEPEQKQRQEIAVRTGVTGMQRRARAIDNIDSLRTKDIKIDAYFHGTTAKYLDSVKLHYNSTSWIFWDGAAQVHYYWPIEGSVYVPAEGDPITVSSLDFVGFCPFEAPAYVTSTEYKAPDSISFTCDVSAYMTSARQDTMQEYVVAVLDSQTYATQTAAGGALPLQFKHSFAQIKFVIMAASGTHVQVDSIRIDDLYTGGTCTYDGNEVTWDDYSAPDTVRIIQTLKIGGTTETKPFLVIPDNYGTKYLTVSATWDDWSHVSISDYGTNVSFNWEAGHSYTYKLTLDKYGLKVDEEKFTEQW